MATNYYSADSAYDPHPLLLNAAGSFVPTGDIVTCMASVRSLHTDGVTPPSFTQS
jgi:hypothetical protein